MKSCKLTILDQVNIKFSDLDPACRRDIVNALKFMVPYARHTPQFKLGRWDGMVSYATVGGSSYFNLLDKILPILIQHGYSLNDMEIVDNRSVTSFNFPIIDDEYLSDTTWPAGHPFEGDPIMMREHQTEAINKYLQNPQSLQEIATGAGKTIICGSLSKIVEPYGRSLVIVPGKDLVMQTCLDYFNIGIDTGRYFGDFKEPNHKHTIATWQSLTVLSKKNPEMLSVILKDCAAVIVDECHTISGKELREFLTGAAAHVPLRWGLTGTLPKEDFEFYALLASIGPKVGEVAPSDLQELGILANCNIEILQTRDNVTYKSYDDEKNYLSSDKERLKWVADLVQGIQQTGNTLMLVNSIEMGKYLSQVLDAPFIYGDIKTSKRGEEYASINTAENKLLIASYGVASTGISINRIFNLIMFEGGKSPRRIIQSIGRGLRVATDKDFVNIYDICSTANFSKKHLAARKTYYKDKAYPFTVKKIDYR